MGNIKLDIDNGTIGTGTPLGIGINTTPIDLKWTCNECDEIIFNPEIVCSPHFFNCELCPDDIRTYERPWVPGDCLYFQLQNQNTLNAPNPISLANYIGLPFPKIPYGWHHSTLNPTQWTIRATMVDACTDVDVNDTYFEPLISEACVGLVQDVSLSYKGYPQQAWYRWVQNLKICMDPAKLTNIPDVFYMKFIVKKWGSGSSTYYSQPFRKVTCENTITLEGIYDRTDCLGFIYGDLLFRGATYINPNQPPINLDANCLMGVYNSGYSNIIRLTGECYYNGETISRETPYRQKASTTVRSYKSYRNIYKPVPPYIAAEIARNLEGKYALLTGAIMEKATLRVKLEGSLQKNWDMGRYWYPDFELTSFECVQDMNCGITY